MRNAIPSINQARRQKLLGQKLRHAREEIGLNQDDVGHILSLSASYKGREADFQSNLSRLENGRRQIKALELEEFARLYGKPLSFFATLSGDDEKRLQEEVETRIRKARALAASQNSSPRRAAAERRRIENLETRLSALKEK
jgi:transcriptional regulator with XRE-family HTH domain